MKTTIKQMFASILLLLSVTVLQGQSGKNLFIGVQPELNLQIKPETGDSDLLLPSLVIQKEFTEVIHLRLSSLVIASFGDVNQVSLLGFQAGVPLYFFADQNNASSGIYLTPLAGFIHNRRLGDSEISFSIEPGYTWCFPGGFTMNLGIQFGDNPLAGFGNERTDWSDHIRGTFSLGYTLKSAR